MHALVNSYPNPKLQAVAEETLPLATLSLYYAALYAMATLHPRMEAAAEQAGEQGALLERITTAGLIPFSSDDDLAHRRAWLDSAIDRLDKTNPLMARYAELHAMRLEYLPRRN